MKDKFKGPDGERRLVEAVCAQPMIEYNTDLAKAFIANGTLVEFANKENLTTQGLFENHVFFVLAGEVNILVNSQLVGTRKGGESIGEMFLVSPLAARTATVTANGPVLCLRVTYTDFQKVATTFPNIWRSIARIAIERLIEKDRFQRQPSQGLSVFVGSSLEGLSVARIISDGLKHYKKSIPKIWSIPGIFSPGGIKHELLLKEARRSDFAVFAFGPDDKSASREKDTLNPRDNVIFELGLFTALLDKTRVFIVKDQNSEIKIPRDLVATVINYTNKPGQLLTGTLAPACEEILGAMNRLGTK